MNRYAAEVERHLAWVKQDRGPSAQRALLSDGSAECVFLAGERMLTLLVSAPDENDDLTDDGCWFWACERGGQDVFEFTISWHAEPTAEQRTLVVDFIRAMGTALPFRLEVEPSW